MGALVGTTAGRVARGSRSAPPPLTHLKQEGKDCGRPADEADVHQGGREDVCTAPGSSKEQACKCRPVPDLPPACWRDGGSFIQVLQRPTWVPAPPSPHHQQQGAQRSGHLAKQSVRQAQCLQNTLAGRPSAPGT